MVEPRWSAPCRRTGSRLAARNSVYRPTQRYPANHAHAHSPSTIRLEDEFTVSHMPHSETPCAMHPFTFTFTQLTRRSIHYEPHSSLRCTVRDAPTHLHLHPFDCGSRSLYSASLTWHPGQKQPIEHRLGSKPFLTKLVVSLLSNRWHLACAWWSASHHLCNRTHSCMQLCC